MIRKSMFRIGRQAARYPFCTVCLVLSTILAGANVWLRIDLVELTARGSVCRSKRQ